MNEIPGDEHSDPPGLPARRAAAPGSSASTGDRDPRTRPSRTGASSRGPGTRARARAAISADERDAMWREITRLSCDRFGACAFRPGQQEIMDAILSGRDVLGIMPTGAGKSLTFQLPAQLLPGVTVVVSPLIALMQDQREKLAEVGVDAAEFNSRVRAAEQAAMQAGMAAGTRKIVYVTPERMEKEEFRRYLATQQVSLFVVDEAHCISQWGHDFRPAYLALGDAIRELGRPPVLALTATATEDIAGDIVRRLGMRRPRLIHTGVERPNLTFEVDRVTSATAKRRRILAILRETPGPGIIYAATVRAAVELHRWLHDAGVAAGLYHGRLRLREREDTQRRFMANEIPVLIATSAFGLGVDKPDIRFVIHYHFPDSLESYYQEAGRAGRDGLPARAILLYRREDRRIQAYFLGGKQVRPEETWQVFCMIPREGGTTQAVLRERTGLGEKRVKIIVARLLDGGVIRRPRKRLIRERDFPNARELEAHLQAREDAYRSDRERLREMMHYAESAKCRYQSILSYFGEPVGIPCARCDNCLRVRGRRETDDSTHRAQTLLRPPTHDFHPGDAVRHFRFGQGLVKQVAGGTVEVDFADGVHRIRSSYLDKLPTPQAPSLSVRVEPTVEGSARDDGESCQ